MTDPFIENRCFSATAGRRIRIELTPEPETTFSSNIPYSDFLWEQDANQPAAVHLETPSRIWRSADFPSPAAADTSAQFHTAVGIPNPLLMTPRCWPPTGPTDPACLVDADWELARALAADPFHLDWPHW